MQNVMSALPPIADICGAQVHVRFVPIADIRPIICQPIKTCGGESRSRTHRRVKPDTVEKATAPLTLIYCALFLVSWTFCWSSFSSAAFMGTSLTVSLLIFPENRNGGW